MVKKTEIIIKARTIRGDKAISQHYKETSTLKMRDRLIFKTAGYKQEILNQDPKTLLLTMRNMHSQNPSFIDIITGEIKKAFKLNGAYFEEDYSIGVNYGR